MSCQSAVRKEKSRVWLKIILSLMVVIVLVAGGLIYWALTTEEYFRRISCASNLVSLGLAFKQYAMDFDDNFPDKNGVAGLEILRREEYCGDPKAYMCPSSKLIAAGDNQPLVSAYEYRGGLKFTSENARRPLMWDKCGNHKNCCNVLFCDGHVESVSVKNGKLTCEKFFRPNPVNKKFQPPTVCPDLPPEILRAAGYK